jgi:cell wall-associated NlpC family hydrolase
MRLIRFLLLLLALAFTLALALLRPLPARAAAAAASRGATAGADDREPRRLTIVHRTSRSLLFGRRVVGFARRLLGAPYRYGGSSPRTGFDCSGFVRYVYSHFGVSLPHSSYSDLGLGRRVGRAQLRPGDLVFFDDAGHVGIYVGAGRFIHAPHTGTVVRIETMSGWYGDRYVGARRIR